MTHKRDLMGYADKPPHPHWPNDARIAISFVVNYEEGAENTPYNNDAHAETYGAEFPLMQKPQGMRHLSMESLFEYGARVGIWRLMNLFDHFNIPITVFMTGLALELNPKLANYFKQSQHEIAGHGWRWIDYSQLSAKEEKQHIEKCIAVIEQLCGQRPQGWYTGRTSESTRQHLLDIGGFIYDSDSYADDLPFYYNDTEHLIIPYTLDCNDFRYTTSPGYNTPDQFFHYLKNSFDYLYAEGKDKPKMMTIGLHPRISGKPGRCGVIKQFIEYIKSFEKVWITKRIDIANHWLSL